MFSPFAWFCVAPVCTLSTFPLLEKRRTGTLPKDVDEGLIIIPDKNRLAYSHGRGPQIAGGPE